MNKLRALYASDPNTNQVILQFQQITDLSPLLFLLQRFTSMQKLSLHGNRLRQLPHDMYILESIKQLDISNNMFVSPDVIQEALASLPNLRILTTNVKSKQDQQRIARKLPNLQLLNGQLIRRQLSVKKDNTQGISTLSQQDLQIMAGVFDEVRQLFRRGQYNLDQQLANEFDQNVENVIHDLTKRLTKQTTPHAIMQARIQCAKYALLDLCFIRAIDYVQNSDPVVGGLLIKIHDMHANVFKEIANLVLSKNIKNKQYQDIPKKQHQIIEQLDMLKRQRGHLYDQINQLELQNAKYLQILTNFGLKGQNTLSKSRFDVFNGKSAQKSSQLLQPVYSNSKSPSKGTLRSGSMRSQKQLVSSDSFKNLKNLSLGQTIELMSEIMEAKFQQNQKNENQGTQHQTLQHHMYSFFNKKYGLKNLTVEWAMSLVNAIKNYSDNPTVSLFGRILRNQIEQYFWLDQQDMVQQIDDLFKIVIKQKSNKLDHEIQQILMKRKSGTVYLQQCYAVLQTLFSQQDSQIIIDSLNLEAQSEERMSSSKKNDHTPRKLSHKTVKYQTFINLVLQRNLINYQKRSQKFVRQFKKLDTDSDGMLSQHQTMTLIKRLLPKQSDKLDIILKSLSFKKGQLLGFSVICSKFYQQVK